MITIRGLQYEPQQRKAAEFGTSSIALFAGDMQTHAALTIKTDERLKGLVNERKSLRLTVKETADIYAEEFASYRRDLAEREVLAPRGLSFKNLGQQLSNWPHYQVRDIEAMITAHVVEATAIVAGIDHLGAHLYVVRDPGVADSQAVPCFACAGGGKDIAETQFMVGQYDKRWPLAKALWLAFSAKARAQVAGGVGPKTDLIIVSPGKIEYASEMNIQYLNEMFGRVLRKEREYNDEAVTKLEANLAQAAAAERAKPGSAPTQQGQPDKADQLWAPRAGEVGDTGALPQEPSATSSSPEIVFPSDQQSDADSS
jgi:hypothetical protein